MFTNTLSNINITEIRQQLFLQDSPFVRIPNVIPKEYVSLLQQRWKNMNSSGFAPFISNVDLTNTDPNYHLHVDHTFDGFYLFPWNKPADQYTHQICLSIHQMRNQIEGGAPFKGLFSYEERFVQFRVLRSMNGESHVPLHSDFIGNPPRRALSEHVFDPNRIQATLLLSEKEIDYTGEGFTFMPENCSPIDPCAHAKAGDLLLWRYNEPHMVKSIYSSKTQLGFLRIIFPVVDQWQ
jgi:hypothetical protein